MSVQLVIEPGDVWLFRDGRPFDAGSDHRARSYFPPLPSVIQGALRSAYITQSGTSIADYIEGRAPWALYDAIGKGSNDYGRLTIRGPFVCGPDPATGELTRYYPLPGDLIWLEPDHYERLLPRKLSAAQVSSVRRSADTESTDLAWLISDKDGGKQPGDRWISETDLVTYLQSGKPPQRDQIVSSTCLFVREPRVGLQIVAGLRAAQESLLYEAEFVRPCRGVGLAVSVDGVDAAVWGAQGVLLLGGERRYGVYRTGTLPEAPVVTQPLSGKFCLYLLTPTWFDGGWQPQGGDWGSLFTGDTSTLGLRAARVGHPVRAGGIDLAASSRQGVDAEYNRRTIVHKPARPLVPAGSVYFFEATGQVALKHNNSLCNGIDSRIGFGQVLAGTW
jgi:CRISPR-associated protein Cmr3